MIENNIPPCMIYIDKNGKWFHKGVEMIHRGIINEFYRNMKSDSYGNYIIVMGKEKCLAEVEDTPFIITRVEPGEAEKSEKEEITLFLIDDTRENLVPETLSVGEGNILYCRIKDNTFKARFSRAAYYQLASFIKEEGDKYYLPLNNTKHYIKF